MTPRLQSLFVVRFTARAPEATEWADHEMPVTMPGFGEAGPCCRGECALTADAQRAVRKGMAFAEEKR